MYVSTIVPYTPHGFLIMDMRPTPPQLTPCLPPPSPNARIASPSDGQPAPQGARPHWQHLPPHSLPLLQQRATRPPVRVRAAPGSYLPFREATYDWSRRWSCQRRAPIQPWSWWCQPTDPPPPRVAPQWPQAAVREPPRVQSTPPPPASPPPLAPAPRRGQAGAAR